MEWKTFLLQSGATFIAVFLGIKLFSPTLPEVKPPSPEALLEPLHALEVRLDKVANMLAKQLPPRGSVSDRDAASINIDEINRNLRTIIATLTRLETKEPRAPLAGTPAAGAGMPLQPPPMVHPARDWIQGLTENKRVQVNEIFREQAILLKEKIAAVSGEGPPPLDKLPTFMEENTQELKNKLQSILNEDEYRSFLDSLPTSRPPTP